MSDLIDLEDRLNNLLSLSIIVNSGIDAYVRDCQPDPDIISDALSVVEDKIAELQEIASALRVEKVMHK